MAVSTRKGILLVQTKKLVRTVHKHGLEIEAELNAGLSSCHCCRRPLTKTFVAGEPIMRKQDIGVYSLRGLMLTEQHP